MFFYICIFVHSGMQSVCYWASLAFSALILRDTYEEIIEIFFQTNASKYKNLICMIIYS